MFELPFSHFHRLAWLLLVVVCAAVAVYGFARKSAALRSFAEAGLLAALVPDLSRARQYVKAILTLVAMTCMVAAAMGPRWGTYYEDVFRPQLDIMICLDVSRSMLAEDAGMSRLERAKDDIKRLIPRLSGASIGLVAFAGRAELVCPLTDDYEFYKMTLDDVGVHSARLGGTNLAEALKTAAKSFEQTGPHKRVIFVMTDGENHGEGVVDAATDVHKSGVDIYTIGIGDADRGGLIPTDNNGRPGYVMHDGQQVWSKLDEATLRQIATAGGSVYEPSRLVSGSERTLEWLYNNRVAPSQTMEAEEKKAPRKWPRYHWPAGAALILLAVETMIAERRGRPARENLGTVS